MLVSGMGTLPKFMIWKVIVEMISLSLSLSAGNTAFRDFFIYDEAEDIRNLSRNVNRGPGKHMA